MPTKKKRSHLRNKTVKGGGLLSFFSTNAGVLKNIPINLKFGNNILTCDVCKANIFYKKDVSVKRSKTFDVLAGDSTMVDHPLALYMCNNCCYCKIAYVSTKINGYTNKIEEFTVDDVKNNEVLPSAVPPE